MFVYKDVNHADRVVFPYEIIQTLGQQGDLLAVCSFYESPHDLTSSRLYMS
jgi:hypothetical protein